MKLKSILFMIILLFLAMGVSACEKDSKPLKECNENGVKATFLVLRDKSDVCQKEIMESKQDIRKKMDPGLNIILNTDKNCFNKKGCEFPLIWQDAPVSVPDEYTVAIPSTEKHTYLKRANLLIGNGKSPAYITYFTHNHGSVKRADGNKTHKLYKTDHGVIIQDRKTRKWAWLFISNIPKLRWPSMCAVSFAGKNEVKFEIKIFGQKNPYRITFGKESIKMRSPGKNKKQ